jgi:hypothetical protein
LAGIAFAKYWIPFAVLGAFQTVTFIVARKAQKVNQFPLKSAQP